MREISKDIRNKGCYKLPTVGEGKDLDCREIVDISELNAVSKNLC